MSETFSRARKRERDGDLPTAARLYASAGFETINGVDFDLGSSFRFGIATFISSISCDVRAGNVQRATGLRYVTEGAIRYARPACLDDQCLVGLYHEWLGDIHLMTGSDEARTHYENALKRYERVSECDQLSWGMAEEFDYSRWATLAFLEADTNEVELPELDFEARVHEKLQFTS